MTPIPLAVTDAEARSRGVSTATLVNLYAARTPPGAKAAVALYGTPGTRLIRDMGAPVRGLGTYQGRLVAVTGSEIARLNDDAELSTFDTLATIEPTGPAEVASTSTACAIVSAGRMWMITNFGIQPVLTEADQLFVGNAVYPAETVCALDEYLIFNRSGTGQFFFVGPGVTAYNMTFDGLDFATAEGAPDDTVAVLADHRELWLFGEESTEIWYNNGAAPFLRIQGAFIPFGCASPWTPRRLDNSVFWLGHNGMVYRSQGYQAALVSTDEIAEQIAELQPYWATARAIAYYDRGHAFYCLTIGPRTFCYDAGTGLWHRRAHHVLGRWQPSSYAFFGGRHIVGTDEGQLLEVSADVLEDWDQPIVCEIATPPVASGRSKLRLTPFEIDLEAGQGARWVLDYSDDRGMSWSSQIEASAGAVGHHAARLRWHRLPAARERVFRIRSSDRARRAVFATAFVG